ncbi:MAG: TIM barrel protein [Acidimicrobiia bacterium]|nr:TIM barrel protein [Acidimicrobiia bacterium]
MIRFGYSGLPPDGVDDAEFLDGLVEQGHGAYELAFVKDFPWNEKRCAAFGKAAADRGVALSVHAPYFAILTVEDEDKRKQCLAALEHTMKLGRALGAHTIVAHTGHVGERTGDQLHELVAEGLTRIEPKVSALGVALGLETSGTERAFGSLGDIALIANRFSFVRPVIDWAHVHAKSGGALVDKDAFRAVIDFLRAQFPGWAIDPLHTQFTDNEFGAHGEIRHIPYGTGSIKAGPLAEAATEAGLRMIVISEAKDAESHAGIFEDLRTGEATARPETTGEGTSIASGVVDFPEDVLVDGSSMVIGFDRALKVSNTDKVLFPGAGITKGDLITYYRAMAPLLLPHLEARALSMSRLPDGIDGHMFYEKQTPKHAPEWIVRAPIHSQHRGEPIEFVTAPHVESLMWLANMACIEVHPWLSRVQQPDRPDFAIFDLDPMEGVTWDQVVYVARLVNIALERLGLAAYLKTTGSTGLHIYVPLDPVHSYRRVRTFVERIGQMISAADPDTVTMEWDIPKRGSRVFIDSNQNVGGKTIASVYSVRPRPGAPVSVPITWDELDTVTNDTFTMATVWERVRQYGDLFAPVLRGGQRLDGAERGLGLDPGEG